MSDAGTLLGLPVVVRPGFGPNEWCLMSPAERASQRLRSHGLSVEPSDIPGLFVVDGSGIHGELTIGQLLSLAFGSRLEG